MIYSDDDIRAPTTTRGSPSSSTTLYGKTVEEKAKEAPVRAERDPMGHRGALHDPYAAAVGAGEE